MQPKDGRHKDRLKVSKGKGPMRFGAGPGSPESGTPRAGVGKVFFYREVAYAQERMARGRWKLNWIHLLILPAFTYILPRFTYWREGFPVSPSTTIFKE